jgi:hypothetical protein
VGNLQQFCPVCEYAPEFQELVLVSLSLSLSYCSLPRGEWRGRGRGRASDVPSRFPGDWDCTYCVFPLRSSLLSLLHFAPKEVFSVNP